MKYLIYRASKTPDWKIDDFILLAAVANRGEALDSIHDYKKAQIAGSREFLYLLVEVSDYEIY